MASVRDYFRAYRATGGIPETPTEEPQMGTAMSLSAAVLVGAIGFAVSSVVLLAVVVAAYTAFGFSPLGAPTVVGIVLGLAVYAGSKYTAIYIGGPIVDYCFGIRREGVADPRREVSTDG